MKINPYFNPLARAQLDQLELRLAGVVGHYIHGAESNTPQNLEELHKIGILYSAKFFEQFKSEQHFEQWLNEANPDEYQSEATYLNEYRALYAGTASPLLIFEKQIRPDDHMHIEAQYERLILKPYYDFKHSLRPV